MEPIEVEPYNQPTKKLNSKTQSTTSTDQHKSTKNEGFYKAVFYEYFRGKNS